MDTAERAPRRIGKKAPHSGVRGHGRRVTYPDVLAVIHDDETRSYALSRFRGAGFSADSFGHLRKAREAMVDARASTEDPLEYREIDLPRRAHWYRPRREAIRGVHRRLELELFP